MNNKGFTVIELLASFSLTMLIVVFLFQIVLDLKDVFVNDSLKTQIINRNALIATSLSNKLDKDGVYGISCDSNLKRCVVSSRKESFDIVIDTDKITIGNKIIKVALDEDTYIDLATLKIYNDSDTTGLGAGRHNSYLNISFDVVNKKLDEAVKFNYVYTYNGDAVSGGDNPITIPKVNLYVSSSGNDSTGDGSLDNPYKTILKAYNEADNTATIYVKDDLSFSGVTTLNGGKNVMITSYGTIHTLSKSKAFSSYILNVESGSVTLENITLDGKSISDIAGGVLVSAGAKLTINDNTTIKNFVVVANDGYSNGGGVRINDSEVSNRALLVMNGGSITGNKAPYGGGIHFGYNARMIYNGGTISDNGTDVNSNFGFGSTGYLEDTKASYMVNGGDVLTIKTRVNTDYAIDVSSAGTSNGTNIQAYQNNGSSAQKWKFKPAKAEDDTLYYTFQSQVDGSQYLWIDNNSSSSGVNIWTWEFHGSSGGYFALKKYSDGYYQIKNIKGTCVDLSGGTASNGSNIQAYTCNDSNAQKWKFVS